MFPRESRADKPGFGCEYWKKFCEESNRAYVEKKRKENTAEIRSATKKGKEILEQDWDDALRINEKITKYRSLSEDELDEIRAGNRQCVENARWDEPLKERDTDTMLIAAGRRRYLEDYPALYRVWEA